MDTTDSLREMLNRSCVEAGLCPDEAPRMKHAAELWRDGSKNKILIGCFEDGAIVNCLIQVKGEQKCCFSSDNGGEELYENWCGLLTSPEVGYKIKVLEVEG